jgi:hypothetical protein
VLTLLFENRDTIRFQVQEMARAERILTDAGIQAELDVYNALMPQPDQLSATLFVELTDDQLMRHWLPRLVGVERSIVLRLPGGDEIRSTPEEDHESQLTRESMTASVHYVRFAVTPGQVEALAAGPVFLAVDHPEYREQTELTEPTRASLVADLRGTG